MKVIGLTGGVGMGKSACAQLLRERRINVIDTDDLARQVVEPGQPALAEIQIVFGSEVIAPDGSLSRSRLARLVFADPIARAKLEAILHPRIRRLWLDQVALWRREGQKLAAVAIPLLFETKAECEFDLIVCVACSVPTQLKRLAARGWDGTQIEHRNRAQWTIEEKIAKSQYVIWTEGDLQVHAAQLDRILTHLAA